jgi:hypothetical protein
MPRHPRCDCLLIPARENVAGDFTTDPAQLVRRGLITDLTPAQRERLADGADLSRVLNESRDRWRQRMVAQRRAERSANRAVARAQSWGRGGNAPQATTIHDLFTTLTSRVDTLRAMRAVGIAD